MATIALGKRAVEGDVCFLVSVIFIIFTFIPTSEFAMILVKRELLVGFILRILVKRQVSIDLFKFFKPRGDVFKYLLAIVVIHQEMV